MYTISGSGCRQALCSWIKTILGCNLEWAPTDLSNLLLWLDASQITGLNDGDAVASWTDLSGNGNHATQSTAAAKPTYKTNIITDTAAYAGQLNWDGTNLVQTIN